MSKTSVSELESESKIKLSKHEIRTQETRSLLLKAAETVFIRYGYEGADLNDIAELAERTKGAIYGHFKSKEDIFLALVAEHREQYREKITKLLSDDIDKNVKVMRQFVLELAEDDKWALLQLEFKLFTLRHPETKVRFQQFYATSHAERDTIYAKLFGPPRKTKNKVSRGLALHSLVAMLSALLLEAEFEPELMSKAAIRTLIASAFDCLFSA